MDRESGNLQQELLDLGFPDHQLHDLVFKLRGTSWGGEEIGLFAHTFKCRIDLSEIFQELTKSNVLQKLSALTTSEYSWCFRPDATFESIEEFAGRVSRHIFSPKSSSVKSYEFLVETSDGRVQVVKQVTEYIQSRQTNSDSNEISAVIGIIGPTGYFNFLTK
jgi:hypothetical protein